MEKHFVYLLESEKDKKFYIGQTNNIFERLKRHNQGMVISTKRRKPFRLLGYEEFYSRKEALQFEKRLKTHSDQKLNFIKKFKIDFKWNLPD